MSITRSLNKHNGIYYAYETTYEWNEEKQKKVQKKRCIGQFVPGTDEIIPNGPRGKKPQGGTPVFKQTPVDSVIPNNANVVSEMEEIRTTLKAFEKSLADLSAATRKLADQLDACVSKKHS
jgi:hypothetical protein